MFLQIPQNHKTAWACIILTDAAGKAFYADIVKFSELTVLDGVEAERAYLTIIDTDTDWQKLVNRSMSAVVTRGTPDLQWKIRDAMERITKTTHANSKAVVCVDTGERFVSALACANAHELTYGQLLNHLNHPQSWRSVKKKKYRWA